MGYFLFRQKNNVHIMCQQSYWRGIFWILFFLYVVQHCFICCPSASNMSEDAGTETQDYCDSGIDSQMLHATTRLDLIHIRLDLIYIFFITSWCFYIQLKSECTWNFGWAIQTATEKTTREYRPQINLIALEHYPKMKLPIWQRRPSADVIKNRA